mgnify:CR=1 FL=1
MNKRGKSEMNYTYDTRNFRESFERDFTYINGFMRNVDRYGNRPALYCPIRDRSYTYSQLNTEVNKLANALAADGVGRGDVVLYSLFNSIEFALCYLAPQKLAAVHSPSNYRLAPGETAAALEDNRPKVFIYDAEVLDEMTEALSLSAYKPDRIVMADITDSQHIADDTVAIAVEALDVGLDVVKDHGALQLGALVGVEAHVVGVVVEGQSLHIQLTGGAVGGLAVEPHQGLLGVGDLAAGLRGGAAGILAGGGLGGFRVAAAGKQAECHHRGQKQCKSFFHIDSPLSSV